MPRIRSVHPDLCTSETMARVSAAAERTFVRLWTHCDDDGRAEDHPKLLKAALLPLHDDVSAVDIDAHLTELEQAGQIVRYEVDGKHYLEVVAWKKYQHPQRPTPSKLPPSSMTDPRVVDDPARSGPRGIRGGVGEGEGVGGGAARSLENRIREYYATRRGCDPSEVDDALERIQSISQDNIERAFEEIATAGRDQSWPRHLADRASELQRAERRNRPPCEKCNDSGLVEATGGVLPCADCNASALAYLELDAKAIA